MSEIIKENYYPVYDLIERFKGNGSKKEKRSFQIYLYQSTYNGRIPYYVDKGRGKYKMLWCPERFKTVEDWKAEWRQPIKANPEN